MRMVPARFVNVDKPAVVKQTRAKLAHVSPPINGLADVALTAETDPKFAGILVNVYPEDDRITCRAGFEKVAVCVNAMPIEHLIPYYGTPERLLAADAGNFCDAADGTMLKSGFTANAWHWTAFSNLGEKEYVVMVNGADGVWSWDGGNTLDSAAITITKIAKATSPAKNAVVTVGAGDIAKFLSGDNVIISGADSSHANANGPHLITSVNSPANTFTLIDVDSTAWSADQTTGTMRAVNQGSFNHEDVRAPAGNTWLQVNDLQIVVAHMNRLFFADEANLAIYYLPLLQKTGELSILPLNSIFKKGGTIRAMNTWTVDGGRGIDDQLCIFTSNGEVAIYSGVDPDTDFSLVGVYRFDPPMSKWCTVNYGGELYAQLPTGLTAMSTVLKSGREGVEASDKNVVTRFLRASVAYKNNPGWELFLNPNTGRMFCNIPQGGERYGQMIRAMAKPVWSEFRDIPARCWGWLDPYVYFGDDMGNIYRMHPSIQSDDNRPIYIDVQMAWNDYGTPALKHFKMICAYVLSDGVPVPSIDVKVDYDSSPPENVPDISGSDPGATSWDTAPWDTSPWVSGAKSWSNWTGVASLGRVGAIRMQAAVYNTSFSVTGFDILYDQGSVFG